MTEQREIDRLLDHWFSAGPTEAPDRVIDIVADRIERQHQRPAWRLLWTEYTVNVTTARSVAAMAAIVIIAVVGYGVIGGSFGPSPGGSAAPSASATTSPTPMPTPTATASPSPTTGAPSQAASATGIVLQRAPTNLGCDSIDPGYRSVTIHIDPESDIYLEIANPAYDGSTDRVNVDVWGEADNGKRLAVYWSDSFNATDGNPPVIHGARGEEVARDGSKIDAGFTTLTGYFTCGGFDAIYVLDYQPG